MFVLAEGNHVVGLGEGAIYALVSIMLVFLVLALIIGATSLIFKWFDIIQARKGLVVTKAPKNDEVEISQKEDEDLVVAVLVASIDYQNEIKKDVRVVSAKLIG